MSPRTPTLPPNDRGMWRRLVSRAHPDSGGDHELFIWTCATRDVICGGELGSEIPRASSTSRQAEAHREAYATNSGADTRERVPFHVGVSFVALTERALEYADELGPSYARLLRLLSDCYEADDGPLYKMQQQGATYKSLAAIAYKAGMEKPQRVRWYRVAESIPLSQRHAGHILSRLQERAA